MKYLLLLISSFTFGQQTQFVDFKSVFGKINIDPETKTIYGNVTYEFQVLKPIDTLKIDAQNMIISDLKLNGKIINYFNTNKQLQLLFPFKKGKNKLIFNYSATPTQALYFVGSEADNNLQIWTQGQGKYTSNWFPSFDDVKEKLVFNLEVAFDKKYQVVSNGKLFKICSNRDLNKWHYRMQKAMSSYLLMLAIGKFYKKIEFSNSGIPIEMYCQPKDTSKNEPTYRYSKLIFDFLESQIGVKYPWKIYKQIPVRDFLYAGMENTSATTFSSHFIVDSIGYEDRNYTNVNAHELAHQWFGDLVTAESGKHHWLQEGFATYYALLAEKKIYGDDYFYSKLYEYAQQLQQASKTDTIPILNAKASSLSFYQKGAWSLHVLHEGIGDKVFKKAVQNYLKNHSFQTVNTEDFFNEIKKLSNFDLENFSKVWLEQSDFNIETANELLLKNKNIKLLFEIEKFKRIALSEKAERFQEILQSKAYFLPKEAIVYQLINENFEDKKKLLAVALNTNSIQVRQAVASTLTKITKEFRIQYESLLDDKSYQTQEIALYNLWNNFPEYRFQYLNQSKDWIGFNDYNLRILWLSLAIETPHYIKNKDEVIQELIGYSSTNFETAIRKNALEKLIEFHYTKDVVLKNLINATTHHLWQFSKFGRDNIRTLLKNQETRISFERILPDLNEKEQFQLNRLLRE